MSRFRREAQPGDGIRIKGEFDQQEHFQAYLIDSRESSEKWDIFSEHIGVVDHINHDKKIIHFIVDKNIDGILNFSDFPIKYKLGDTLALRLATFKSTNGIGRTALTCIHTGQKPTKDILYKFSNKVKVSNGLGFTDDSVFIDKPLVEQSEIEDGDRVEGLAVLNYNKKRGVWGWKAIHID